jgi:hypothetical protein
MSRSHADTLGIEPRIWLHHRIYSLLCLSSDCLHEVEFPLLTDSCSVRLKTLFLLHKYRMCLRPKCRGDYMDLTEMLLNDQPCNFYSSSNIIWAIKSRSMRWVWHVARIEEAMTWNDILLPNSSLIVIFHLRRHLVIHSVEEASLKN